MLKVVIIDDEYFFRESIKTIIPWNEMNLLLAGEANNGEDALELIQKTQPDMALVDINMPIIGGIELASILNEQGIKTRIIIITGYSEFEYAQKAIKLGVNNYLLKPIVKEELLSTIAILKERILIEKKNTENIAKIIQNRFLKNLIKGNLSDNINDDLQYAKSIKLDICKGLFRVAILDLDYKGNIQERLTEIFARNTNELIPLFTVTNDDDLLVLILQITDEKRFDNKYIKHCMSLVTKELKELYLCTVSGGIGRSYRGPDSISLSYREAVLALKTRIIKGNQSVALFDEENIIKLNQNLFSLDVKQNLFRELRVKNKKDVELLIKKLFDKLKEQKISEKIIKIYAYNLLLCAIEFCSEFEQLKDEIEKIHHSFIKIEEIKLIEDLDQLILKTFISIMDSLSDINNRKSDNLIFRMKAYILDIAFDSNFSIQMVSDHFSMNYHYTCSFFKSETGQTINDFMTEIRMIKAKEYLKLKEHNVSSVAFLCGYRDQYYFSRVFSKYYGLPPSRFK
jgi:two-component system response regulator YesN